MKETLICLWSKQGLTSKARLHHHELMALFLSDSAPTTATVDGPSHQSTVTPCVVTNGTELEKMQPDLSGGNNLKQRCSMV